jgi:flagellar biosynthesis anti-sigma factor FlgM
MKIDSGSLPPDPARIGPSQGATASPASAKSTEGKPAVGDAVQVSTSAQLAAEAARRLAESLPKKDEVRAEVVERAKAALAKGEVGTDLDRLADRLIDGMLDE